MAVVIPVAGVLSADETRALAERTFPVLGFVAALTVVAELCAGAGLFAAAAELAARAAGGRRWLLWVLVVLLATLSTVVLSLDTTAVLLTPVVIALARHTRSFPLPFALVVVALANTASLVLPVSNLTNLLADHTFRAAQVSYIGLMWVPALVAILVTVLVLGVRDRSALRGRYEPHPSPRAKDPVLLRVAAIVTGVMAVAFVVGVTPWAAATVAALVLLVVTLARRRPLPVPASDLVPWRTLLVVLGLFVAVEAAHAHGAGQVLASMAGDGDDVWSLLRLAGVGVLTSNAVNNLPAYLALEPATGGDPLRVGALLIGTGAGAILTPWGSLATVLWWQRARQVGLHVRTRTVVLQGLLLGPAIVVLAVLALVATS